MTATSRKFRLPRKTVFLIGGILLLGGATGACALYMGREGLLGGSEPKVSALACTTVKTFKIRNKDRFWIRKFIKTDPAEGLARVATALRVAEAVYEAEKPDLVQVVVLDQRGPEQRANMRGRAIGADVVYVPHPEKNPDLAGTPVYSAKYVDGAANEAGQFYGEKIQLPPEHIESLVALLPDHEDCVDPAGEDKKAGDAKSGAHGAGAEESGGHGAESAAPEAPESGHAPAAGAAHDGEKPAEGEEGHGADATAKEAAPPVYDEPSIEESPIVEAPAEPQAEHEAAAPSPAVSDEQTSAAAPKPAAMDVHEAPAPQAHGEPQPAHHAAAPVPAVSDEQTSAAAAKPAAVEAHEASVPEKHGETASPEHGASASAAVAPEEPVPQDFYDEPSVNGE